MIFVGIAGLSPGQEVDDIRPAKDLVVIPEPPNYLLWVTISLVGLIGLYLLWRWLRSRSRAKEVSPADLALEKIERAEQFLLNPSSEPLVNAVAAALRSYIEARFDIAAPRRTTEEFLCEVHDICDGEIAEYRQDLNSFLRSCDRVKFGRGDLDTGDRKSLLEEARSFVAGTREPVAESGPS